VGAEAGQDGVRILLELVQRDGGAEGEWGLSLAGSFAGSFAGPLSGSFAGSLAGPFAGTHGRAGVMRHAASGRT
jgi:hypothetical protein